MQRKLLGLVKFATHIGEPPPKDHVTNQQENTYDWEPVIYAVNNYVDSTGANETQAGPTLDRVVHLMSGGPYAQTNFNPRSSKSLVVGVGGYGEGEGGPSYRYFDWLRNKPNSVYLRYDDTRYLKEILDAARQSKIPTTVFGHSYGGASIAGLAEKYPEVFFIASDPVSRFSNKKDKIIDNLLYQMPIRLTPTNLSGGNMISAIGGRWYPPFDHTIYYNKDGHTSSTADNDLKTMYDGIKLWLEQGKTAPQIKQSIQDVIRKYRDGKNWTFPETSKEYQDAHSFNGNIPDGWVLPDIRGLPVMPGDVYQ